MNNKVNINEVISDDGTLYDKENDIPRYSKERANMTNKTTDYNVTVGRQASNNDEYLGLLGFNFRESDDKDGYVNMINNLCEYQFNFYKNNIKGLNKDNITKHKDLIKKNFSDLSDDEKKEFLVSIKDIFKIIKTDLPKKQIKEDSEIVKVDKFSNNGFITSDYLKKVGADWKKFEKITDIISSKITDENELEIIMKQILSKVNFEFDRSDLIKKINSFLINVIESK